MGSKDVFTECAKVDDKGECNCFLLAFKHSLWGDNVDLCIIGCFEY